MSRTSGAKSISADSFYTVPYISKATGIPLIDFAAACMLGEKTADFGYGTGLLPSKGNYAVRVPVFSFDKLESADTVLDKKMKSTGEVMGIAGCFEDALLKGLTRGPAPRHTKDAGDFTDPPPGPPLGGPRAHAGARSG